MVALGYLYKLTNINNNKVYIGKTYRPISERLNEHYYLANKGIDRPLYRAINKYGKDSFIVDILGKFPEGLLEKEEELAIVKYNSYGSTGYNATKGGDMNPLMLMALMGDKSPFA